MSPRRWGSHASAPIAGSPASTPRATPGLQDRSSRPHSMPTRTSAEVEARVVAARRRASPWSGLARPRARCAGAHGQSGSCAATTCPGCATLDPLTGEVIRASKTTAVRYERDRPGELVHMDVKKIGRIPDGGGWRAHGRQMGSTVGHARRRKIGFDYVHSVVDDHSRLAYSEILADETGRHLRRRSSPAPSTTSPPTASTASSGS